MGRIGWLVVVFVLGYLAATYFPGPGQTLKSKISSVTGG